MLHLVVVVILLLKVSLPAAASSSVGPNNPWFSYDIEYHKCLYLNPEPLKKSMGREKSKVTVLKCYMQVMANKKGLETALGDMYQSKIFFLKIYFLQDQ